MILTDMFSDHNSNIEKEALRKHVLDELTRLKHSAEQILTDPGNQQFWSRLHNTAADQTLVEHKQELQTVESELIHLPEFITKWTRDAVESPERLDFFIAQKAEELRTGDPQRDYFWALQIRHDQLIAVVRVVEKLLDLLKQWVHFSIEALINNAVFLGLSEYSLEDQIYLEAEKIQNERTKYLS